MAELIRHTNPFEIGIDEAGRGCLAGPVVAASFMPGPDFVPPKGLNDSKKMSEKAREYCFDYLVDKYVDRMGIGMTHADVIDKVNILKATMGAMHNAVTGNPGFMAGYHNGWKDFRVLLLVDGNRFERMWYPGLYGMNGQFVSHETVVKGDGKYLSIAAASVIAKVTRDRHMKKLAEDAKYAPYGWAKNKAYCTPDHIAAIIQHGKSDQHRMTFKVPGYDK